VIFPALAKQSSDTRAEVRRVVLVGQRHCDPDSIPRASIFHSQRSAIMARDNALSIEERKRRTKQNKIKKRKKRDGRRKVVKKQWKGTKDMTKI